MTQFKKKMDKIFEQRFHKGKYAGGTRKRHVKIYPTLSVMKNTHPDDTEIPPHRHRNGRISRQMDFCSRLRGGCIPSSPASTAGQPMDTGPYIHHQNKTQK